MVRNKFGNEIRCQLRPQFSGPLVFVNMAVIKGSNKYEEEREKEKDELMKAVIDHHSEVERLNDFNRVVFWIPRKAEEYYWDLLE